MLTAALVLAAAALLLALSGVYLSLVQAGRVLFRDGEVGFHDRTDWGRFDRVCMRLYDTAPWRMK